MCNTDTGAVLVIHYNISNLGQEEGVVSTSPLVMEEVVFLHFADVAVYKDNVWVYSPQVTVRRARSRLHELGNSVFKNGEFFVNWALTNQDYARENIPGTAAAATYGVGTRMGLAAVEGTGTRFENVAETGTKLRTLAGTRMQ